jgi:ribosomal protein S18 acetylase RimI-like enzyme
VRNTLTKGVTTNIRDYGRRDRDHCLALMLGNTPDFFAPCEVGEFEEFLDDLSHSYYVVEVAEAVVACGGWSVSSDGSASLCWGMVERSCHRKGIGSYLLRERLRLIREDDTASSVALMTSQHSRPFFERYGFAVVGVEEGGFAPGLDAVTMRLEI